MYYTVLLPVHVSAYYPIISCRLIKLYESINMNEF